MRKIVISVIFLFLINSLSFALKDYEISFAKGNLEEKALAIKEAADDGNGIFVLRALDFIIQSYSILGDDQELIILAETSVKSLNEGNCRGNEKIVAMKLVDTFKTFDDSRIKNAVIDAFNTFPSGDSIILVNDFFTKAMQASIPMNETLLKSILFMGSNGNSASFNLMFIADVLDVWPSYSAILANAYGNLANNSEKDILNMLVSVPADKKLRILEKVNENPQISQKIRGEAAETALSSVIYNVGENPIEYNRTQINLQLLALQILKDCDWTRASKAATSFFFVARNEYEAGKITVEEFALAIENITAIASADTGAVLSSYLDFLNKQTEKNSMPVKAVLLSVINSLGELGDKTAFDYLLYVTYLDYPEEVTLAARSALARLKW